MTDQPELHDLTKFLVDRIKTYPEEFSIRYGHEFSSSRWLVAIHAVFTSGTPEDVAALRKAVMDYALQDTLKTLLAPEEPADIHVGQSSSGIPVGNPSAYGGVQGSIGVGGGPSLTQQQAQQRAQQPNSVTISPNVARAMGLKPPTVNETFVETYERIKKRLGL